MPRGRRLVGEDLVDLVAAAGGDPPHLRAVAVALLELGLGLAGLVERLFLVRIAIVLGEAEVNEGALPGVSQGHGIQFRRAGIRSLPGPISPMRQKILQSQA